MTRFDFIGRKFTLSKPPVYKKICYGPETQMKHYRIDIPLNVLVAVIQVLVIIVELMENNQIATKRLVLCSNDQEISFIEMYPYLKSQRWPMRQLKILHAV